MPMGSALALPRRPFALLAWFNGVAGAAFALRVGGCFPLVYISCAIDEAANRLVHHHFPLVLSRGDSY
eukprot:9216361-Heterocapsa_arctica.AAC.1